MHTNEYGEANLSKVSNFKRTLVWVTNVHVVDSLCHLLGEAKNTVSKTHVRNVPAEFVTERRAFLRH